MADGSGIRRPLPAGWRVIEGGAERSPSPCPSFDAWASERVGAHMAAAARARKSGRAAEAAAAQRRVWGAKAMLARAQQGWGGEETTNEGPGPRSAG